MELSLDIFKNDAFTVQSLYRVVDNAPYIPSLLGQMQLFDPEPILTEIVYLYEEDSTLKLIPTTERGAPDIQQIRDQGRLRALQTVRLSKKDSIRAGELQGVGNVAFSQDIRLRTAQGLIDKRVTKLKQELEFTKELHRFGAIQGVLMDADGTTVLRNYWTEYGIAQPATININFSTIPEEQLRNYFQDNFVRPIVLSLKDRATPNVTIAALVGDTFWARLTQHPALYEIMKIQESGRAMAAAANANNPLWRAQPWNEIEFGGIRFINYRGSTGGEIALGTNDAVFFPVGARDVFKAFWAPGETMLDAGTEGRPQYAYVQPDPRDQMPSYVDVYVRAYPLYACIYPKCLLKATTTG